MFTTDNFISTGTATIPTVTYGNDDRHYVLPALAGAGYHCSASLAITGPKALELYFSNTSPQYCGPIMRLQYDLIRFNIYMKAGTYDFQAFSCRYQNRGSSHLYIDGLYKGYIDSYLAGGAVDATYLYITNFSVPDSKIHTVDITTNSKNAGSSEYLTLITSYCIYPHV